MQIFRNTVFFIILFLITSTSCAQRNKRMDYLFTLTTDFGKMDFILYDATPKHKKNFYDLVEKKFYDGVLFHRVLKDFMIQGGDPLTKESDASRWGTGGPSYTVDAEFVPTLTHKKGAIAAARQGDQVNPKRSSSGSQFYIVHSEANCKHLNNQYTVFGEVLRGLEVIDSIANQPVDRMGRPLKPIKMEVTVKEMKKKHITEEFGYIYPVEEKEKKKKEDSK